MSECKHESIDPYGGFCDGCGETGDEIIRNQQAELATLREASAAVVLEKERLSTHLGGPVAIDDLNRLIQKLAALLKQGGEG